MLKNCIYCEKEFDAKNARKLCFECMPAGLSPAEQHVIQRKIKRLMAPPQNCIRCDTEFKMEPDDVNRKYCYSCMGSKLSGKAQSALARRYAKEWAVEYKGGKCTECGFDKNIAALEFHHVDPTTKEYDLSNRFSGLSTMNKHKEELDKCILLCANCHRILHHKEEEEIII